MASKRLPRIIYSGDTCALLTAPPPHTVDSLAYALDYLKGAQVECLCWCLGEQIAYAWPSKVIESIFEFKDRGMKMLSISQNDRNCIASVKDGLRGTAASRRCWPSGAA